jgi:WD40 repeat protein
MKYCSFNGAYLATASGGTESNGSFVPGGNTTLWHVNDAKKIVLRNHNSFATSIALSPDGNYVTSID